MIICIANRKVILMQNIYIYIVSLYVSQKGGSLIVNELHLSKTLLRCIFTISVLLDHLIPSIKK